MKRIASVFLSASISFFVFLMSWDVIAAESSSRSAAASASEALTFERDVRPIFKAMCFQCHGEEPELQGGLDLRLVRLMTQGGETGPAIVSGDVEASLIWQKIASDEMPEGAKKLSPEQKDIVRRWIDQGASTARPEPEDVEDARFSEEELTHWAFQPVVAPPLPRPAGFDLRTPIDAFIAARLSAREQSFSPAADRRTFIRRVTFDLTGLPPTPGEVEAFVSDSSPDAYERVVDRLLASPHYGVRWSRHWLDVAGFAESDGGQIDDAKRPQAWRYRDYVIEAFNSNKPIDEFLREQLAGDELIEGPLDAADERQIELLTATGFLRMAPDPTRNSNTLADRNLAAADAVKVISETVLGLTVGCAQCHDHKYEPIGADDYYRFRAIFDPVFPLQDWQTPDQRLIDLTSAEVRAEIDRIEAEAKARHEELRQRVDAHAEKILQAKLADVPDDMREVVRAAVLTAEKEQTSEQKELLKQYPMVKPIRHIVGLLVEYDGPAYREFEKERAKINEFEATKPPLRLIMASTERPDVIPASAVFFRGDPESPQEPVSPGELTVLSRTARTVNVPVNDETRSTTGRRLAYANSLTDGKHPLTARVFVNRIWQHHFGRGIVATPSDFGLSGARPSHPELLDWLADDFVRYGWDLKRLHRMIVLSTTYRQQSLRSPELDQIDPENELLGRMNLRRLEAEAIRDAIFAVSGELNDTLGGPSVPVTEDTEGKAVIGVQKKRDGLLTGVEGSGPEAARRSAFIEVQRSLPLNMLATFDQPAMNPNCSQRQNSTVATQSLWFLNDSLIVEQSNAMARMLLNDCSNDFQLMSELFVRLFSVPPTSEEQFAYCQFLRDETERVRKDADPEWQKTLQSKPQEAEIRALATLCQALMASNRFLYVD